MSMFAHILLGAVLIALVMRELARAKGSLLVALFYAAAFLFLCTGCTSTVTPSIVEPAQASYSGLKRNSGLISRTEAGWIVDGNFRARYNGLIETYGAEFIPPLRPDAGLARIIEADTPAEERWLIDPLHFDRMLKMNLEKHSGLAPLKK